MASWKVVKAKIWRNDTSIFERATMMENKLQTNEPGTRPNIQIYYLNK